MFTINGKWYQLGDLVRYSFTMSKLSQDEWNALPEVEREHKLVDGYYAMRAEKRAQTKV
jgi:hypothetical protein